jgi:hypothetical protein
MLEADRARQALCADCGGFKVLGIGLQMQGAAVVETLYISLVLPSLLYY